MEDEASQLPEDVGCLRYPEGGASGMNSRTVREVFKRLSKRKTQKT